jgi:pentatricopeptide repeat protein
MISQVAYFASLTAIRMEDYPSVIKYALYGENDKETGKFVLEYLATAYKNQNDTIQWIEILKKGTNKYPDHPFFYGHLIDYYNNQNQYDEAMKIVDEMLKIHPTNAFYLYVKGYLCHNTKDYDNAIEYYKKTIEIDADYAEAYSNLGLIYCLRAQEYAEKSTIVDVKSAKYKEEQAVMRKFYEEAKPYYERARLLKPDQKELWLQGLYRIYYNLNMGKEFDEIEKLM